MALVARRPRVRSGEPPPGDRLMIEVGDLEVLRGVTAITFEDRLFEAELPEVRIVMAATALAWNPAVARACTLLSIFRRGMMAAVAKRRRMRAGQRPRSVIDLRQLPTGGLVTVGTTSLRHLGRKLVSVGIFMAIGARLFCDVKIRSRAWRLVTSRARRGHVFAHERELGLRVQRRAKQRGIKASRRVAGLALASIAIGKLAVVLILMAIGTAIERELSKSLLRRQLRIVATGARGRLVFAGERIRRAWVRREPDRTRKPKPLDGCVATRTCAAKWRLVHGPVARHAFLSFGRRDQVAGVVTRAARHTGMAIRETRPRMTRRSMAEGDRLPTHVFVAILADGAETTGMRIFVTVATRAET